MPNFCCVVKCGNRAMRDNVSFFRIPKELHFKHKENINELSRIRREKWIKAIKREDMTELKLKYAYVCSKHFLSGRPSALTDDLNIDWVPSQNMGYQTARQVSSATAERHKRWKKKVDQEVEQVVVKKTTLPTASTSRAPETHSVDEEMLEDTTPSNSKPCQTDINMQDLTDMFINLSFSRETITKLQDITLCCKNLENNDKKTKYYTGLPSYKVFAVVVNYIKPFIKIHGNTSLAAPEQILLTLVKLRLNLDYTDLGYRFGVSIFTASTYFKNVIHIMYLRFKNLIIWPARETLLKTIPHCFKDSFHGKTTVIIDCFEIRCETPSDLLVAAESWSNYKHSQTIKYLIGITPQGSVCFISEGWGGRVSDKYLTQNSVFLNKLIPGDVVMADRGFLIKEFVELFQATVKIPAFTRGLSQLHPVDLEQTRSIAHVRIHVERVIGLLRQKYRILWGPISVTALSTSGKEPMLDEIVVVACALINLCPPVVPID